MVLISLIVILLFAYVSRVRRIFLRIDSAYLLGNTLPILSLIFCNIEYRNGILFTNKMSINSLVSSYIIFSTLDT